MARLPVPGGDDGDWGDILNEYLEVALNDDGTLKTVSVSSGGTGATTPAGARTNLELGDSATRNVGTGANTVAAGDDSRITGALQPSTNLSDVGDAATALGNLGGVSDADLTALEEITTPFRGGITMRDPNMDAWFADIANPTAQPIDIVVVSDSIGQIIAWPDKLYEQLSTRYNGQANIVTQPVVSFKHASTDPLVQAMDTVGGVETSNSFAGWGRTLSNGNSCEDTQLCDGVFVVWGEGTGTLTVKDGGSGGSTVATIDTSTGNGGGNITSINLGSYASHQIYIESSGETILEGILPTVGNRTTGVRVWRAAHAGYTSADFTSNTRRGLDFIENLATLTGRNPHVVIATGYNDSDAGYEAAISTLIEAVQARTDGSVVLWTPWGRDGAQNNSKPATARTLVNTYTLGHVDSNQVLGNVGDNADANALSDDGAHPDQNGSALLATQFIAKFTGDPIGSLLTLIPGNSMAYEGTFSLPLSTNGKIGLYNLFNYPTFSLFDDESDDQAQITMITSSLSVLAGGASAAQLSFGPGGATSPDTSMFRSAAHTLSVFAGGAASTSASARLGGTIHTNTTAVGNVGTGEDDLMTHSVIANTLATNNERLEFKAAGTIANNANQKRIKVFWGSDTLLDTGAAGLPTSAAIDWEVTGEIIRTGAATQKAIVKIVTNNTTFSSTVDYTAPTRTLSSANTLKLTGEGVSNNDVQQQYMRISWHPAS